MEDGSEGKSDTDGCACVDRVDGEKMECAMQWRLEVE